MSTLQEHLMEIVCLRDLPADMRDTVEEAVGVIEQQAGRIKGMEAKLASFARGVKIQVPTDTMEQEFATHYRRGFDAGKTAANALIEQAREALESCEVGDYSTGHVIHPSFDDKAVDEALAAIERHQKGEES